MNLTTLLGFALAAATLSHAAFSADSASIADVPIEVRQLAHAAVETRDSQSLPFAIIDKKNASVFVYAADGSLRGASPVLLGLARGDESASGIGERKLSEIRPDERTTPAGRFVSEPGLNLQGEDIVWVDYDAAVSMHRVRANNKAERRLERLASVTSEDNRISYGCINVPASFYDSYIKPALGDAHGVIYILPETHPIRESFSFMPADGG